MRSREPRQALAHLAARFYAAQPETVAAVTGTNGKTSVAAFLRQIWTATGFEAASLGTVGIVTNKGETVLAHTTPDPVTLHKYLADASEARRTRGRWWGTRAQMTADVSRRGGRSDGSTVRLRPGTRGEVSSDRGDGCRLPRCRGREVAGRSSPRTGSGSRAGPCGTAAWGSAIAGGIERRE